MKTQTFTIALAPYIDAFGDKRATYTTENKDGKSVAVLVVCNGRQESLRYVFGDYCLGTFINQAMRHFNSTEALKFHSVKS